MKKSKVSFLLLIVMLISSFLLTVGTETRSVEVNTKEVNILVLMDHEYGLNVPGILAKFDQFGWSYTIAGPELTINGCETTQGGIPFDVDILYSDIDDITEYDAINIMPGEGHANLLANKDGIIDVIKDANTDGKIIAAWCRAVRVLAVADIIDGINVTGHVDYQAEYESAGATYIYDTPPIIWDNIITTRRSNFYQKEMCVSIAKAIGCYEKDSPIVSSIDYKSGRLLVADITDESGILSVTAKLLLEENLENSTIPTQVTLIMKSDEGNTRFNCTVPENVIGKYTVTLKIEDVFWNEFTFTNETTINVRTGNLSIDSITIIPVITIILSTLVLITKKKK